MGEFESGPAPGADSSASKSGEHSHAQLAQDLKEFTSQQQRDLAEITAEAEALDKATKQTEAEHAKLRAEIGVDDAYGKMGKKPESELTPGEKLERAKSEYVFLLGGPDAEMEEIKSVLEAAQVPYIDGKLTWETAKVGQYEEDIAKILKEGKTPVAIELTGADKIPGIKFIDHHNQYADRPASISQVLETIGIEPTVLQRLKAANDAKYISGMEEVIEDELILLGAKYGYNKEQQDQYRRVLDSLLLEIRANDREAQGVTPEKEQEAEQAIANAELTPNGVMVVKINGDRPSVVTDWLHQHKHEWPDGEQRLVIVTNADKGVKGGYGAEVWFMGDGEVCRITKEHFEQIKNQKAKSGERDGNEYHSWGGGANYGHKGKSQGSQAAVVSMNPQEIIDFIDTQFKDKQSAAAAQAQA